MGSKHCSEHVAVLYSVDSEIFAIILFSRIVLKTY